MGIGTLVGMWVVDGELLQYVGNLALNSGRGPWGMHVDRYLGGNVGFRWGTFAILWGTLHSKVAGDHGECMGIGVLVGMWVLDGELMQFVGNLALNSGKGPWGMHGDRYLGGNVGFRWGTFAILWGTLHSTVAGAPGECMGIGTLVGMWVLDGELLQFVGNLALSIDMGPWGMHVDMYLGGNVGFRWGTFAICGEPCTQQWQGPLGNAWG